MKNKHIKRCCQICGKEFSVRDLYPNSLIRNSVLVLAQKTCPGITSDGFVCFHDLKTINAKRMEELLKNEKGALSELEEDVLESIRNQDILSENINEEFEETLTFGHKASDKIAEFGGSWKFIFLFLFVLIGWMTLNSWVIVRQPFDPFPYILLNLFLSSMAAFQAPIIMMSQNRQSAKDRLNLEQDYRTNLKAELQIRHLNTRMELFIKHQWQKMYEMMRLQEEILQDLQPVCAKIKKSRKKLND